MKSLIFLTLLLSVTSSEGGGINIGDIIGANHHGPLPGLLDNIIGKGGIVSEFLETLLGMGGLLEGLTSVLGTALSAVLTPIISIVNGLLNTILGIISEVSNALVGKPPQQQILVFSKYDVKQLCPSCPGLNKEEFVKSCQAYCASKGWKAKAK